MKNKQSRPTLIFGIRDGQRKDEHRDRTHIKSTVASGRSERRSGPPPWRRGTRDGFEETRIRSAGWELQEF